MKCFQTENNYHYEINRNLQYIVFIRNRTLIRRNLELYIEIEIAYSEICYQSREGNCLNFFAFDLACIKRDKIILYVTP